MWYPEHLPVISRVAILQPAHGEGGRHNPGRIQ